MLSDQVRELEERLASAEAAAKAACENYQAVANHIQDSATTIAQLEKAVRTLTSGEVIVDLKKDVARLSKTAESLQAQNEAMVKRNEALLQANAELRKKLGNGEDYEAIVVQRTAMAQEIEILKNQIVYKDQRNQKLQTEVDALAAMKNTPQET